MVRFIVIILLFINTLFAQHSIEFFPSTLNVKPFFANQLEPKMGVLFDVSNNNLRLDIGNSFDIVHKNISNYETISLGTDFFTYSLLRRQKDFKFPVEAIDYLFGINLNYLNRCNKVEYGLRFRLSHISAHLVDGSYSIKSAKWNNNLIPFVYSREFFELTPFIKIDNLRLYSTINLIYHVKPSNLGKDNYQIGGEYLLPNILYSHINLFIAGDFKLIHLTKYESDITVQMGLQIGNNSYRGLRIYYEYFSGKNIHGQLFNQDISKSSFGLNFDL